MSDPDPDSPTIVVTRRWPDSIEAELQRRYPKVELNASDTPMGPDELRDALHRADIVLPTVTDQLPAELFAGQLRTKLLGNFGAGYDHIDLAAAAAAGITVTNTPGVLTDATADVAMLLMLMTARRASEGERVLRSGTWDGWCPTQLLGTDLTGATLGIIGMGHIGEAVARRAALGFGMSVVYHARRPVPVPHIPGARQATDLAEVLATADLLSLHVPGGHGNRHLIDADHLAAMKPSAILVNTARGDIVDTGALIAALQDGTIAAAGLDVYEGEPHVPHELRELPNVVLLPHLGSATVQTRNAMGMRVLDNLAAFLDGSRPPHRVV